MRSSLIVFLCISLLLPQITWAAGALNIDAVDDWSVTEADLGGGVKSLRFHNGGSGDFKMTSGSRKIGAAQICLLTDTSHCMTMAQIAIAIGIGKGSTRAAMNFAAKQFSVKIDDSTIEINGSNDLQLKAGGIDSSRIADGTVAFVDLNAAVTVSTVDGVSGASVFPTESASKTYLDAQDWSVSDDLGDHTATQNIQMSGFWVSQDGDDEGIFVDTSGKVGFDTSSPSAALDLGGALTLREQSSDPSDPANDKMVWWMSDGTGTGDAGDLYVKVNAGGTTKTAKVVDYSTGAAGADNLGDHTATQNLDLQTYKIVHSGSLGMGVDANGKVSVDGTLTFSSDRRLKKEITPIADALAKINRLRGVTFAWRDALRGEGTQIGLIAQEVEAVFPEAVTDHGSHKSVNYQSLVAPLSESLQTLFRQNEQLREQNKTMRAKQEALLEKLEQLEQLISLANP